MCPTRKGRALFVASGVARRFRCLAPRRNALLTGDKNRRGETGQYQQPSVLGRRLAHTVCIACHYVETVDRGVSSAGAPAFQDMADNPAITAIGPRGFLRTPHETMPDLILAAAETDNVIAYILSLKQPDQKRAGPGRRIEARIDRQGAMTAFLVLCF